MSGVLGLLAGLAQPTCAFKRISLLLITGFKGLNVKNLNQECVIICKRLYKFKVQRLLLIIHLLFGCYIGSCISFVRALLNLVEALSVSLFFCWPLCMYLL